MPQISDIMTFNVCTIAADDSLAYAASLMAEKKISCTVAVKDNKPVGILTEADLVHIGQLDIDIQSTAVNDYLSPPLLLNDASLSVADTYKLLIDTHSQHLLVIDSQGIMQGLLSLTDIIKSTALNKFLEAKSISHDMTRKLITVTPDSLLEQSLKAMHDKQISCIIVVENKQAKGIFSERDATALLAAGQHTSKIPMRDIMSTPLITLHETDSILLASITMKKHALRHIVIVDNNFYPVGVLTQSDIVRSLEETLQLKKQQQDIELSMLQSQSLKDAMSSNPIATMIVNMDHQQLLFSNKAANELFGLLKGNHTDVSLSQLFVHSEEYKSLLNALQNNPSTHHFEFQLKGFEQGLFWGNITAQKIKFNGQDAALISCIDETDKHESLLALGRSEAKYRDLFNTARDMMHIIGTSGEIIDINQAELDALGYDHDELIGQPATVILCPENIEQDQAYIQQVLQGEIIHMCETKLRCKNGQSIPVELTATAQFENGQIIAGRAISRDISQRQKNEQELRRRNEQLEILAQAAQNINESLNEKEISRKLIDFARRMVACESGAMGFYQHGEMVFSEYAKGAENLSIDLYFPSGYGVPGHVLQTKKHYLSHDAVHDPHVIPEIQRALGFKKLIDTAILNAKGEVIGCFEMHDRLDGENFDAQDIEMLESLAGIAASALVNTALLTDLESSQQQLKKSQNNHNHAQALAHLGHWALDITNQTLTWSDEVYKIFEIDLNQFEASYELFLQAIHPADRDKVDQAYSRSLEQQSGYAIEHRLLMPDGRIKWVYEQCETSYDDAGKALYSYGTVQDISQQKQAAKQQLLLESAIGSIKESILITDKHGIIEYVNHGFTQMMGYQPEEVLGKTPAILNSHHQSKEFYINFWHSLNKGEHWSGRIMDRRKDGTVFPLHMSIAPIFNEQQEITNFVAVHEDLSANEALQKKMMQAQKMEAVGTMVGGISHDFNNLLASVIGNLYLMRKHFHEDEKTVRRIQGMEEAVHHGAKMIQQMLTFARKDRPEMQSMSLRSFIKEAHKLASPSLPENIEFVLSYSGKDDACVKADATQLQQVILNLVTNAKHAAAKADNPKISLELLPQDPSALLLQGYTGEHKAGHWYCLRCVDNGCGIHPEDLEHIFDPFFTTKAIGEGTGLGLAMVYGAVQNHQGIIDVQSTLNVGTTISIYLPAYQESQAPIEAAVETHHDGHGLSILLVDDDSTLRRVLSEVLEHHGFQVTQAINGEEAVRIFTRNHSDIQIIIMDVVMPAMGGVAAAKEIRDMGFDVPIIFQTGYGVQTQLDSAAAISHCESLQKPVQVNELLNQIHQYIKC
ncbi:MAG: PAS domain S-box protein [Mariprofundaceae bacterium]